MPEIATYCSHLTLRFKWLTTGELFNTFQSEKLKLVFGPEIYSGEC